MVRPYEETRKMNSRHNYITLIAQILSDFASLEARTSWQVILNQDNGRFPAVPIISGQCLQIESFDVDRHDINVP